MFIKRKCYFATIVKFVCKGFGIDNLTCLCINHTNNEIN